MILRRLIIALAIGLPTSVRAGDLYSLDGVKARVELQSHFVQVGKPVWAFFSIENNSNEPVTLAVPGLKPEIPSPEVGLPLAHVFSGNSGSGITVSSDSGRIWEMPVGYQRPKEAPILTLAPGGFVGAKLDLRKYYPAFRNIGTYRITWQPYGSRLASETIVCEVAPLKQVEIVTDFGTMTAQFFYEDAPETVANFIELVKDGFYNQLMFHRIETGYLILGGCPRGDGTGIRPDGKRIAAEFNTRPHQKGSISMALLEDDPDSASCQFFICYTQQKEWDGRYTIFAQLIGDESFATLDRLMATPTDEFGRPQQTLYIRSARLTNAPYIPPQPGQ